MKLIITVAGSRSGNEFFFSLLDGHSEILQFPGVIRGNTRKFAKSQEYHLFSRNW